jgi:Fe-S oxidoreductase/nitrate reductase gamma subunit
MTNMQPLEASREVLWNVSTLGNVVLMYAIFGLSMLLGTYGVWRRIRLWSAGKPDNGRLGNWGRRFELIWTDVFEQRKVDQDSQVRVFHNMILWGFIVLLFTTTMVFFDHDLGIRIYRGHFYLVVTMFSDTFGLLLLFGVIKAYHRRFIVRPDRLHSTRSDVLMLLLLGALVLQGFGLEALRIHVTDDPWKAYSYVGYALSLLFWPLSPEAGRVLHFGLWWFHTLTVFFFFAIFPYSKFFHIFASSANLYFREIRRPKGAMKYPGDIEQLLEAAAESEADDAFRIGTEVLGDLTWKQRLDLDSCTSCGRCQAVCPAYNSGKMLSPKWLILDTRDHMLTLQADGKLDSAQSAAIRLDSRLLKTWVLDHDYSTVDGTGTSEQRRGRAANPEVQASALSIGRSADAKIAGEVMKEDVFWSCTTCRACMEVCPVGIEHVDLITDVRRSLALMNGSIPSEAQSSLRAIETRGNPFGPADQRQSWTDGLNVPILKAGDSVEVLYWVGCVSAYDKRKQKIARSVAAILNAAGVSWGILGNREHCTGDPARRLGEENLFQSSAKKNIETLQSISFRTVIANCPHCFNTLKNEYPQIGAVQLGAGTDEPVRIIHHSQYIQELLKTERILVTNDFEKSLTFHDPCYLGRYNDVYDEPRDILVQIGGKPSREMAQSRERGMCCGAGGGHFWMDMKQGERVNVLRANQAAETGAEVVATACPFCMQMMEDGMKLTNREETTQVRDIAELVAEQLLGPLP